MTEKNRKHGKILASLAAASLFAGVAPGVEAQSFKTDIEHKGRTINVSCNALDGHARHADRDEMISLRRAEKICKVKEQQEEKKKAEEEAKRKHHATGFQDAEHQANQADAAALVELLGEE